jgi:hypothetical protein
MKQTARHLSGATAKRSHERVCVVTLSTEAWNRVRSNGAAHTTTTQRSSDCRKDR